MSVLRDFTILNSDLDEIEDLIRYVRDQARWLLPAANQQVRRGDNANVRGGGYNDPTGTVAVEPQYVRMRSAVKTVLKQTAAARKAVRTAASAVEHSWPEDPSQAGPILPRSISESEYQHAVKMKAKRDRRSALRGEN